MKSLPSRTRWRGVSRFEPYPLPVAQGDESEIRSSPVYAGYAIKPLKKHEVSTRAPAVLDRIEAARHTGRPLPASPSKATVPLPFKAIHADVLKGMVSCRIWFSECVHGRASNGQHVRRALC